MGRKSSRDKRLHFEGKDGAKRSPVRIHRKSADSYDSLELHALIERLKAGETEVVEECVRFTIAESKGHWHGRARAKICRQFKNHAPDDDSRVRLVGAIVSRLQSGKFSEQFKDQLKMAIRFDRERLREAANELLSAKKGYVERYARWILHVLRSSERWSQGQTSTESDLPGR